MRRRFFVGLLAAVLGGTLLPLVSPSTASAEEATYRRITFPVGGRATYSNDWGDPAAAAAPTRATT